MQIWLAVLFMVVLALAGVVGGFFLARKQFEKQMRENPPINEDVIRIMMSQMGRTPSQKQVNQVMKQINSNMK
ncbi:MAG: YneF family protein [Turicibacter sp.]|nr:YneF family protein [Turicibacter sp.]